MSHKEYSQITSIQFEIIKTQFEFLKENKKCLSDVLNNSNKFSLLERRNYNKRKYLIDSFEQVLVQTLDASNQLVGNHRLSIFLLLMHRIEKIEQRLLCLHILRHNTPRESHESLVQSGIFRVLSKWIQFYLSQDFDSEDSSGIPVLIIICHLLRECYYLDINIAKKYDILRLIKRIGKVSSNVNSTDELQQAVNDLKTSWQEEVNRQDSVVRAELLKSAKSTIEKSNNKNISPTSTSTTSISSISEEDVKSDKNDNIAVVVTNNTDDQDKTNNNANNINSNININSNSNSSNNHKNKSKSIDNNDNNDNNQSNSLTQQISQPPKLITINSPGISQTTSTNTSVTGTSISTATTSTTSTTISPRNDTKVAVVPARTNHQPLNVLGKFGANQIQDLIQTNNPRPSTSTQSLSKSRLLNEKSNSTPSIREESTLEILQQAMLPKMIFVKSSDVKGILKKNTSPPNSNDDSNISVESEKPKSVGRLISWNEKLFDIRYFEVETSHNITKSTSRLRQEVHQKKIMVTNCEWKKPEKRPTLPEDQVDVHSFEESIQRKRLVASLQRFYPDDDDIPSDPEDDPSVNDEPLRRVSTDYTLIPWDNDEVPAQIVDTSQERIQDDYSNIQSFSDHHSNYGPEEKELLMDNSFSNYQNLNYSDSRFNHQSQSLLYSSFIPSQISSSSSLSLSSPSLLSSSYLSNSNLTSTSNNPTSTSSIIQLNHINNSNNNLIKSDQVCRFYNQPQGCRRGTSCPYIHDNFEKKRFLDNFDNFSGKRRRSRSPSPPKRRSGLERSISPPMSSRYGRSVIKESNYIDTNPLRQTRYQMNLTSTIYASDRVPSPPSPPPLKNPNVSKRLSNTVCSAYVGGGCRYGYKCHYLHDQIEMFGDEDNEDDDEDDVIPIPKVSPNTWNKTIDRDNSVLVRMKGLPSDTTYADILQFFTVFDVRREAIKIVMRDNRRTGEAYVKFYSPNTAVDAIRALNMKKMGNRFIELFQADYYDADRISIL